MLLSKKSVETLIDLVEIKLSCIETFDAQDARIVKQLAQCRQELYELSGNVPRTEAFPFASHAVA